MNVVAKFFKDLLANIVQTDRQRREAYLAKSTDIHDLEYRLKEIDLEESHYNWVAFSRDLPKGSM